MIFVFLFFVLVLSLFWGRVVFIFQALKKHWLQLLRACWRYLTRRKGRRRTFFLPSW